MRRARKRWCTSSSQKNMCLSRGSWIITGSLLKLKTNRIFTHLNINCRFVRINDPTIKGITWHHEHFTEVTKTIPLLPSKLIYSSINKVLCWIVVHYIKFYYLAFSIPGQLHSDLILFHQAGLTDHLVVKVDHRSSKDRQHVPGVRKISLYTFVPPPHSTEAQCISWKPIVSSLSSIIWKIEQ